MKNPAPVSISLLGAFTLWLKTLNCAGQLQIYKTVQVSQANIYKTAQVSQEILLKSAGESENIIKKWRCLGKRFKSAGESENIV